MLVEFVFSKKRGWLDWKKGQNMNAFHFFSSTSMFKLKGQKWSYNNIPIFFLWKRKMMKDWYNVWIQLLLGYSAIQYFEITAKMQFYEARGCNLIFTHTNTILDLSCQQTMSLKSAKKTRGKTSSLEKPISKRGIPEAPKIVETWKLDHEEVQRRKHSRKPAFPYIWILMEFL